MGLEASVENAAKRRLPTVPAGSRSPSAPFSSKRPAWALPRKGGLGTAAGPAGPGSERGSPEEGLRGGAGHSPA